MNTIFTRNMAFVLVPLVVLAIAALCVAPASAELIHHWKLDETSGLVADDAQDNQDGTLVGTPDWVTGGKINGALDFEATESDYVDLGSSPLLGSGDFTVMAWVKAESIPTGYAAVFSQWNSVPNTTTGSFHFGVREGKFYAYQGGGPGNVYGSTVSAGTWYHMAFVKHGTSGGGLGYLDGVQDFSTSDMIDLATSANPRIGCRTYNGAAGGLWDGLIDDVRIYNTALSQAEIQAIVPEPSTIVLLCIGMLMVLGCRYRRG